MKYLDILKQLGRSTNDNGEKILLRAYYDRLSKLIKQGESVKVIEHTFCLMMAGYIMRYVDKMVDYSQQKAKYYVDLLSKHGRVKAATA